MALCLFLVWVQKIPATRLALLLVLAQTKLILVLFAGLTFQFRIDATTLRVCPQRPSEQEDVRFRTAQLC